MGSTSGSLAVFLAILLVSCRADSSQEQKSSDIADPEGNAPKGSLTKDSLYWAISRGGYDDGPRNNFKRNFDEIDHTLMPFPNAYKRYLTNEITVPVLHHFDDMERSPMSLQNTKRNFDEIDHTTMPFPFAFKRYFGSKVRFPTFISRQGTKRNFDEIDYTAMPFPNSYKRYYNKLPNFSRQNTKRNFDEIDFTSMPFPNSFKRLSSSNGLYFHLNNNGD